MHNLSLQRFIKELPKVELHLHLEGAIRPETALNLMRRNRSAPLPENSEQVRALYRFEDLSQFVLAMRAVSNHIRSLEDLQNITQEMLSDLIAQHTFYVEFDCALQKYIDLGYPLVEILEALHATTQAFREQIHARLIVNLQRSHGSDKTAALVEEVARLNHPLVAGIGLSGDESRFPQKWFVRAFAVAREAGLKRTVHAGEALGPESIREALDLLHAQRIDHGTQAHKDAHLLERLKAEGIPLTQCISSNVRLHIVDRIEDHPFVDYLRGGLVTALHTDDPQVFGISLTSEYELAATTFDLSREEIVQILLNGIQGSFMPDRIRHSLIGQFKALYADQHTLSA